MIPDNYLGVSAGGGVGVFNTNLNIEYPFYVTQIKSAAVIFRTFESQRAALHLELGYGEKGGLSFYDRSFFSTDTAGMAKAEYFVLTSKGLDFSALTHLSFGDGKSKFVMNFGPYAYYSFQKSLSPVEQTELSREIFPKKNYDFGIKAGIAYSLNIKDNVFELELRYGHGFINVYEKDLINNALVNQNQVLTVNLLYLRKLKNKNH
jgi:hypothetical protein